MLYNILPYGVRIKPTTGLAMNPKNDLILQEEKKP